MSLSCFKNTADGMRNLWPIWILIKKQIALKLINKIDRRLRAMVKIYSEYEPSHRHVLQIIRLAERLETHPVQLVSGPLRQLGTD
jgi:hypothetical protein